MCGTYGTFNLKFTHTDDINFKTINMYKLFTHESLRTWVVLKPFFYTCPTLVQTYILVPNSYPMLENLKQHNQHQIKVKAQKTMNGP
jgi:hypothetical protein